MLAVILAICFNAFTQTNYFNTKTDPAYYYLVDFIQSYRVIDIYGHVSRELALSLSGCPDESLIDCVRGYHIDPEYDIGDITTVPDFRITRNN